MKMLSSFFAVGILLSLLSLLGLSSSSAVVYRPGHERIMGYDCENVFISASEVKSLTKWTKLNSWARAVLPKSAFAPQIFYAGPPFTKTYILLPIQPRLLRPDEAKDYTYSVVLDKKLRVFAVISRSQAMIKECIMRQRVSRTSITSDFQCGPTLIPQEKLVTPVEQACDRFRGYAIRRFPARYDGKHFKESGKQLYMQPIPLTREEERRPHEPGPYRVVINTACKIVGAVHYHGVDHRGEPKLCTLVVNRLNEDTTQDPITSLDREIKND